MAAVGLSPLPESLPVSVEVTTDDNADQLEFDEKGALLRIKHPNGDITFNLDGKPLKDAPSDAGPLQWFDNLCEKIGPGELGRITEELLEGIDDDLESRKEWLESRARGIELLGLKIETPSGVGSAEGAPVEGMSRVRHPLLQEACIRFNANARSEFLPTDGPVKIRNDDPDPSLPEDQSATSLETAMNHYLTTVATEYYPDTDRMLFMAGFGGDGFKKVFTCPLRKRPVSESVDADDLIVNQSATDLANAQRVTHRTFLKPSTVKRMQILGVYRDIPLGEATEPENDPLKQAEKSQQGLAPDTMRRPKDREREFYEVYCELDILGLEHQVKGKASGLEVPYRVTIDKSSRTCVSVVRNYAEDDPLAIAKKRFVKWPFVPGFGFYSIGLLHILGNTTQAITAAWREMLDSGMFANFPGFLISDIGSRQNTNILRVPPGGAQQIKTGGAPIGQVVAPLPYTTTGMPALMQLTDNMAETGRRIGGTAEVQVGEGRADVPVGTVMAMIDQAIKVMNAVHKRMHAAQAEELQMLLDEFVENPEALLRCFKKNAMTVDKVIAALKNCNIVPQADPNTSSSGQRMMKVMGLKQLQQGNPNLYDPIKVDTAALNVMGWPNPQEFFVSPAAQAAKPPQLIEAEQKMANETKEANAKAMDAQAHLTQAGGVAAKAHAEAQNVGNEGPDAPPPAPEPPSPLENAEAMAKIMDAQTRHKEVGLRAHEAAVENQNRDQDRAAKELDTRVDLAKDLLTAPPGAQDVAAKANRIVDKLGKKP